MGNWDLSAGATHSFIAAQTAAEYSYQLAGVLVIQTAGQKIKQKAAGGRKTSQNQLRLLLKHTNIRPKWNLTLPI